MLYYGDKYRKKKVLEIFLFSFFIYSPISKILNQKKKKKKIAEIEFFFLPPTSDFR